MSSTTAAIPPTRASSNWVAGVGVLGRGISEGQATDQGAGQGGGGDHMRGDLDIGWAGEASASGAALEDWVGARHDGARAPQLLAVSARGCSNWLQQGRHEVPLPAGHPITDEHLRRHEMEGSAPANLPRADIPDRTFSAEQVTTARPHRSPPPSSPGSTANHGHLSSSVSGVPAHLVDVGLRAEGIALGELAHERG